MFTDEKHLRDFEDEPPSPRQHEPRRARAHAKTDNAQRCPQGDAVGSKYAAEQKISEQEALKAGMEQKSKEFAEAGAELYSKA